MKKAIGYTILFIVSVIIFIGLVRFALTEGFQQTFILLIFLTVVAGLLFFAIKFIGK